MTSFHHPLGCDYCDLSAPVGSNGCFNNGVCYNQSTPGGTIPYCGCTFGFAPPQCNTTVSTPICNATSAPPSCAYCDPTAPIGSQGCENGGQCYYQPLDGVPPPGLPICGCLVGFDAPQCATVTSPPLPICNASNPAEQYPSCLYCDPRLPAGEDGCFNGGSCYYETNFPGAPPTGVPVCGCPYGFAPPSCFNPAPPLRICNASDPSNPQENFPNCQYCDPALSNQPNGNNGCLDFGFCRLQALSGPGIPPNAQLPICECQLILLPPQCAQPLYPGTGNAHLVPVRWAFFTGYVIVFILAWVVIGQHFYYAVNYKLTKTNLSKLIGAVLVMVAAMVLAIDQGWNPLGQVFKFPTVYMVQSSSLLVNAYLACIAICTAINTANWIRIGLAAISPAYRGQEGWPVPSHVIVWVVVVYEVVLGIFLACWQVNENVFRIFLYLSAGTILVMLVFSVISGIFVLATIQNIDTADPKLLRKTASQLIVIGAMEAVCGGMLIALSAADFSGTTVITIFGLTSIFPFLVQAIFLCLLLIQFRIAIWQLKEVALTRHNTATFESSARATAQSYNDDGAVSATSVEDGKKIELSEDTGASSGKKDEVEVGLIEL